MMKNTFVALGLFLSCTSAMTGKNYTVSSPDGRLCVNVDVDDGVKYSVEYDGQQLIAPSTISMKLNVGGRHVKPYKILKQSATSHNGMIAAVVYKKATVQDNYRQTVLKLNDGFELIVRAYDEGAAYRFVTRQTKDFVVESETADFTFAKDWQSYLAYTNSDGTIEQQFFSSFENGYTHGRLSALNKQHLSLIPFIVEADNGVKIVVTEADLEDYPGMYVLNKQGNTTLEGVWAHYPKEVVPGGYHKLQQIVNGREPYIARCRKGMTNYPWRVISISTQDRDLLGNDMVYRLAAPNRIGDVSWIKPGKVAWDWWNCWGIYNVPFKAGVNTETYKYYIDFASKYGIEYVILDEGWSVDMQADLFQVVPEIDLKEIIEYGKRKHVGIILWAGWYAFERDMDKVCRHYSKMGVKGFKIDIMNRDDALMVSELYKAAATAAKYRMLVDYHGVYKPTGMNRTYPNVLNFEGVKGLEHNKWSKFTDHDQVTYDVTVPFARMLAGQMDYTQGAMLNGTKSSYRPSGTEPMSQGTRTRQLAEYLIFFSPLNMLCDSPTHYLENHECTDFISKFPVTWDETVPLESKVGEYVAIARRSGDTWYVGAITGWKGRDFTFDLSKLGVGGKQALAFKDGVNADKIASDYVRESITVPQNGRLTVHMAGGGGFVMKISK